MKDQYTFKSITLKTSKLSEQYQFYVENLAFHCVSHDSSHFTIQCGSSLLTFEASQTRAQYHFAFNIPENQIEDCLNWIKKYANVIPYEKKPIVDFPNWNAHSIYFIDPSENIVEFIARHNLPNALESKFSAKSICEISEMGIPAENIEDTFDELKSSLDFDMYWGNLESFAAIGHERCLFITVPTDRIWFQTETHKSKIEPIKIKLINNFKSVELNLVNNRYIISEI